MLELLGSIFSAFTPTVAGGGILGLIGSAVSSFIKLKKDSNDLEREVKLVKMKYEQELALYQLRSQRKSEEGEHQLVQESYRGLSESIIADRSSENISRWVANTKSLFRPFLTLSLIAISAWVVFSGNLPPDLYDYAIRTIIFTTAVAVSWWFGDRAMQPPRQSDK